MGDSTSAAALERLEVLILRELGHGAQGARVVDSRQVRTSEDEAEVRLFRADGRAIAGVHVEQVYDDGSWTMAGSWSCSPPT